MAEERIGRYQITQTIASGTQGAVYRAFDLENNRIVALKVLHPTLTGQQQYLERFRREATLMSAIDHPNVVKILDAGIDPTFHRYGQRSRAKSPKTLRDCRRAILPRLFIFAHAP